MPYNSAISKTTGLDGTSNNYTSVGVIIGRFQVNNLTEAHEEIINYVINRHKKVIILLGISGISPVQSTKRNPLDFETRQQMIKEKFPNVIVSYVKDMKSDIDWSKQVDSNILNLISPNQNVMLYGGRDSFIKYYYGKFQTEELMPDRYFNISGTELRNDLRMSTKASSDFRAGVIWANENQYDSPIAVVDVAVFNDDYTKILLGRKLFENEYRFFGGFVDINKDKSYEDAAKREVLEECNIEISSPIYITSSIISDWRYRNERDKIYTTLFATKYIYGSISPSDDIFECKWFDFDNYIVENGVLLKEHIELFNTLKRWHENERQINNLQ